MCAANKTEKKELQISVRNNRWAMSEMRATNGINCLFSRNDFEYKNEQSTNWILMQLMYAELEFIAVVAPQSPIVFVERVLSAQG